MSGPDPDPDQPSRRTRFLERHTYRRARLEDAARLLPLLGLVLVFAPIVILTTDAGIGGGTGQWLVYFMVAWLVLVILAAAVSRALSKPSPGRER